MGKKTARITVRLTPEMKKELEEIATLVPDRTSGDMARLYISRGIEDEKTSQRAPKQDTPFIYPPAREEFSTSAESDYVPAPKIPEWFHHIRDPIIITDRNARTLWFNKSFTQMCGYTIEELSHKNPGSILQGNATDRKAVESMRLAVRTGTEIALDLINYHKDGHEYRVHLQFAPVLDPHGQPIYFAAVEKELAPGEKAPQAELQALLHKIITLLTSHTT